MSVSDREIKEELCKIEQKEENKVDTLAKEIADEIRKKRDRDEREYGAGIYRTPEGSLRRTELFEGPRGRGSVTITFAMPSGSRIVADIHSHPTETFGSDNSAPSGDDWNAVDDNYFGSPSFADSEDFSMYIVSPRGELAEFDHDKGRPDKSRPSNKKDARSEC